MSEEDVRRTTNWWKLKLHCKFCSATNVVYSGVYRRKWVQKKNGQWELREQEKIVCGSCNKHWWK